MLEDSKDGTSYNDGFVHQKSTEGKVYMVTKELEPLGGLKSRGYEQAIQHFQDWFALIDDVYCQAKKNHCGQFGALSLCLPQPS